MTATARAGLAALARAWGVETRYRGADGEERMCSPAAVRGVLDALGAHEPPAAAPVVEPVTVAWADQPARLEVGEAVAGARDARVLVEPESGEDPIVYRAGALRWRPSRPGVVTADLPGALAPGCHRVEVAGGGASGVTTLLRAPRRAPRLPASARHRWGVVAHALALRPDARRRPRAATGTLTDLDDLAAWAGGHGAAVVGTLPLLASFLGEPCDPSPYAPVSRRFWNELVVDLAAVPEVRDALAAPRDGPPLATPRGVPAPGSSTDIDFAAAMRTQRERLHAGRRHLSHGDGPRRAAFEHYRATTPDLHAYAWFRAAVERHGADRSRWPSAARERPLDPRVVDHEAVADFEYAQWLAAEQMTALATSLHARGQHLYLDLPVGCHPAGFDPWRSPDAFVAGATVGAPPDEFFATGQDWGFPPLHPRRVRDDGHAHLRAVLAHNLQHAGVLRIDHVMGLHRLWFVPAGASPSEGAYVRYPVDELAAVVCIEANRHHAAVVGENLGTVPREVDDLLDGHGWLGLYVAEFALAPATRDVLPEPSPATVASIGTHDTATFGGFWSAADVAVRERLGIVDRGTAQRERTGRLAARRALARLADDVDEGDALDLAGDHRAGDHPAGDDPAGDDSAGDDPAEDDRAAAWRALGAVLERLGASDAALVVVALEDLWLEPRAINVPGVAGDRYPSWRLRMARTLGDLARDAEVSAVLDRLGASRDRSASRSGAVPAC